jgi:hypothetical protein
MWILITKLPIKLSFSLFVLFTDFLRHSFIINRSRKVKAIGNPKNGV